MWPPDPVAVFVTVLGVVLYEGAMARLRARGLTVSMWQRLAWYTGVALIALGLLGPVDALAEGLLSAHMAQHLLIADLAAPLLLVGLRSPVLVFMLPAPALRRLARLRRLRRALAALRRPLVAIAVYVGVLYTWHVSFMFEGAVSNPVLHALQHQSFVAASLLVWWAALEPGRRRVPGELWKAGHIMGARLAGMFLGMGFLAIRVPIYVNAYGSAERPLGLAPVADQQIAGGMMLGLDLLIMLGALTFFFWRAGQDHDRSEARASAAVPTGDGRRIDSII